MEVKSVRSAVVIIPPEKLWNQIQKIRRVHDKAYERWMPHVNCLYPFLAEPADQFEEISKKIKHALDNDHIEPFEVVFNKESFGYFKHGKKCGVWLKPLVVQRTAQPQPVDKLQDKEKEKPLTTIVTDKQSAPQPKQDEPKITMTERTIIPTQQPLHNKNKVQGQHITIVEPIHRSPYDSTDQCPGINALTTAVYGEDDTDLTKPTGIPEQLPVGIDCLRYAVWTDDNEGSFHTNFISPKDSMCGIGESTSNQTSVADNDTLDWEVVPSKTKKKPVSVKLTEKTVSNSKNEPEVIRNNQMTPIPSLADKLIPSLTVSMDTTEIVNLQSSLVKEFPVCKDLNTLSKEGYKPHLTLGQCDAATVEEFVEKLKVTWEDIRFTVDSVFVISRQGREPFKIRKEVKLNKKSLS